MRAPKIILAATDFSPLADIAVEVALRLARRTEARVHLIHVLEPIAPNYPASFHELRAQAVHDERKAKATATLERIAAKDLTVTREVVRGIPSRELVIAAERASADLVVIATHGHKGIGRIALGSVAASIIRMSQVPVLVVGAHRHGLDFQTVVAAVDLSPVTREVIDLARIYGARDARVEVVSFYEAPLTIANDLLPYYPTELEMGRLREERVEAIRRMIPSDERAQVNIAVMAQVPASTAILETTEQLKADLVVIGTSGHNAWHRAFIGSTATRVLSEARCPVLVVPCQSSRRGVGT